MSAQNRALVHRFYDEVLNRRDPEAAREICTPDYAHHDPTLPEGETRGIDGYLKAIAAFFSAFPDFRADVKDMASAGDKVAVEWVGRGVDLISTHRVTDGRIAESWVFLHLPRFDPAA